MLEWPAWMEEAPAYVYRAAGGQEYVVTHCPEAGRCADVTMLKTARDGAKEFWIFERRQEVRAAIGNSYGRAPVDIGVIGDRRLCELVRARIQQAMPTEPCEGPRWVVPR